MVGHCQNQGSGYLLRELLRNRSRIFRRDEWSVGPPNKTANCCSDAIKVGAVHRTRKSPLLPVIRAARFIVQRIALIWTFVRSSRRTTRCEMLSGGQQGDGTIVAAADWWSTSRNDLNRCRATFDLWLRFHGHCRCRDEPIELAGWRVPLPPGGAHVAIARFAGWRCSAGSGSRIASDVNRKVGEAK